ncbi:salivary secreted angiopoietin [Culex quinquefasciatus]|uniref:Salivary secreted angiopoietin n=1 Tax=Culex quinquefasciatus TaxID=7176 RepID=B0XEN4_CULQU|nr:salivary secreted angiopoietin [Culex quinquefasciatus]|eukprot:XP_001868106.1 salivary secreted angiopoietin [Culex quinquefasciatus]
MVTYKSLLAVLGLLLIGVHSGNASTVEDQMRDLQLRLEQMFEEQGTQIKQLTVEMNQLKQTVERLSGIVQNVDQSMKIVESNHDIVMRNLTHVTDQSNEIMVNQQFCANHDRLRDLYFELLPRCEDPTVPPVTTQQPPTPPVDPNVYQSCAAAPPISGVYNLVLRDNIVFQGYCEQNLVGGGWLVFQTRFDGSVDFNRSWAEYRDGFGDPSGEHWLGLKYLNQLTTLKSAHLLIDMEDYALNNEYAYYSGFVVGPEQSYYSINSVGNLHG